LFKINGGKITSCTQKNLLEVGLSSFIYTDIFFSIGKNTGHLLKKLDGNCKKIYPVGSLYMESDWFKKKKDLKNIQKTDLLILGINTVLRHHKFHITDAFDKNYYKFIEWVAVFSQKFPKLNANILGVIRDEKFIFLKKNDVMKNNDKAYVIINSSQMKETLAAFGHNEKISNKILIIGGGNVGFNLAKNIENTFEDARLKIIEKDKKRAEFIANELNNTIVINGNGLDEDILEEVNLEDVETVIALTNDDEENLMASVLVEKFSKEKRTMALINKPNYSLLQSSLKIDDLIDPRMTTVSSILKHVHKGTIENAYSILNGEYEVIEAEIIETSELVNKELKNSNLPDEIKVGAVLRKNEIIIPRSSFVFQKKDIVVFLTKRDQLPLVENMFRLSAV